MAGDGLPDARQVNSTSCPRLGRELRSDRIMLGGTERSQIYNT